MNYFQIADRYSQSRLKKILIHPRAFLSKNNLIESEDKIHFVIGSAVDCLLTERELFNDLFYISTNRTPTGQTKLFLDTYHKNGGDVEAAFTAVGSKVREVDWFKAKLDEDESKLYLEALKSNKSIVDSKTHEIITQIVESISTFPPYKALVTKTPDTQIITQLEVMWEYQGVPMKSKLDVVVIDFKNKKIYPIDIKTTGDSSSAFQYAFWKRRYDFQAVSYTLALRSWMEHPENMSQLKGFSVEPFRFVVESSKYQGSPLMFVMDEATYNIGLNGGTTKDGKIYEGFNQAIFKYKWHTEHNKWDYTYEQYDEGLIITI